MASSPSSKSARYSRGDYRGCMGGIIHLFDFNQALAGRKYITDKIRGEGLETAGIIPDGACGSPVAQRKNTRKNKETLVGREPCKGKKPSGTSIKSLIAQELSEESEPSDRTPNVVARLMGLDAFPVGTRTQKDLQSVSTSELSLLNTQSDRKCLEENPACNVKTYVKKAMTSPLQHLPDPTASRDSQNWRACRENDITSCGNCSQESQLQGLESDFAVWQNHKFGSRSAVYHDLDLHWDAKQRFVHGKLHDVTSENFQENLACTKQSSQQQEKLHESKEFLDAMDFLQCNKEFFMRFLQDPEPLFTKYCRDNQDDPVTSQPTRTVKNSQTHQCPELHQSWKEASKFQSCRKKSTEPSRDCNSDQQSQLSKEVDTLMERNNASHSLEPTSVREVSVLQVGEEGSWVPFHSRPRPSTSGCQVPTRIVVLKPSPGKTCNLNSPPLNYQMPSENPVDEKKVISDDDQDIVLHEMKERLWKEREENPFLDKRTEWLTLNEHGREILRDQREIAQKIARQVKECTTRDPRLVSRNMSYNSTVNSILVRRNESSKGNMPTCSDGETNAVMEKPKRHSDQYNRNHHACPHQNKQLAMQSEYKSKEGKRRSMGRCSTVCSEQSVETPVQVQMGSLRKVGHMEDSFQCLPNSKSTHSSRAIGRHSVDGTSEISKMPFTGNRDKKMETGYSSGLKEGIPITLLRSHSAPLSSTSGNGGREEHGSSQTVSRIIESSLSCSEKAVNTLTADSNQLAGATTGSIFSRKVSGLKGSFSLRRKHAVCKESGNQTRSPCNEQIVQVQIPMEKCTAEKVCEKICVSSQNNKYQMEDITPIAESESSLSLVDGLSPQQFSNDSLTTDSCNGQQKQERQENHAVYQPESMLLNSLPANDIPASIGAELPKEQSEQPSPVSVLDIPFLEDLACPVDFNKISSELQELRTHLRLLKYDEPWTDLDTIQDRDSVATDETLCQDGELHPQATDLDRMFDSILFPSQAEQADFEMDKMECPCPIGKEPEMFYVRNLLVASGFTGDSTAILTLWYAPGQPLDPLLFQKVESNYSCKDIERGHTQLNSGMRHLLFDQVNEVLLELLWPYVNDRPWMKHSKVSAPSMPTGKDLVKHVWNKVFQLSCSHSECQETLESLMTKDLVQAGDWIDHRFGIESVGLEVEKAIFHDLIEEILLVL